MLDVAKHGCNEKLQVMSHYFQVVGNFTSKN